MSIAEIAGLAGLDVSYVGQIELGKRNPSFSTLARIAKALAIPLKRLFDEEPEGKARMTQRVSRQVQILLRGRTPAEREDLLVVLKKLRNRKRLAAIRQLFR